MSRPSPVMPSTLSRDERVRKSGDFRRTLQRGRRYRSPHLTLIAFLKYYGKVRLGLTVSKKVGNAVIRNRVKRRLRELVRLQRHQLSRPWDLVIIAQPGAGDLSSQALWSELKSALEALAKQDEAAERKSPERGVKEA
ncbi:MAG: ribonuclease P protein component [Myxococcota bacterium]